MCVVASELTSWHRTMQFTQVTVTEQLYKCPQGKGNRTTRVTSQGTGRSPTHTAMEPELCEAKGTLWAGLRPHATLSFHSSR